MDSRKAIGVPHKPTHSIFDDSDDEDEKPQKIIVSTADGITLDELQRQSHDAQLSTQKPTVIKPQENTALFFQQSTTKKVIPGVDLANYSNPSMDDETIITPDQPDNQLLDAGALPDEPTIDDYLSTSAVSIENFGLALLRGQGWAPGKGIGLTNNMVVEEPDYQFGNSGTIGLGASATSKLKTTLKELEKSGKTIVDVVSSHKGRDHQSGESDQAPPHDSTQRERSRNYISSKLQQKSELEPTSSNTSTTKATTTTTTTTTRTTSSLSSSPSPSPSSHTIDPSYRRSFPSSSDWVRERLYVKITDRNHQYYKHKGTIDRISQYNGDIVISLDRINGKDSNRHETRVSSSRQLETVIPSSSDDKAVIILLRGDYRGCCGYIVTTDHRLHTASVKVKIASGVYIDLHYISFDDICQFI